MARAKARTRRPPGEVPTLEQLERERRRLRRGKQFRRVLSSTVAILLVVAALSVLIATQFLPVLKVSGSSMEPTLENGDVIVLVKTSDFETGELVGLRMDGKILLKRIIGGPGDWIDIDEDGVVSVNGEALDEPYVTDQFLGSP